jgi:hypothetical protein
VALDTCVPPGLRGEPYGPDHYIFSNNSEGLVEVRLYVDSECTQFRQLYQTFYFDNCSTSGDAAFYSYSAQLPTFTLDYASVEQVTYLNSSNNATDDNCDTTRNNDTVLTYSLYSNTCRINCYFDSKWEFCTFDYCVNSTANVTYFDAGGVYVPAQCDAVNEIGYAVYTSSCEELITCYNPTDFPPIPSNDGTDTGDDDEGLSVGGVIGIVIASVVVAAAAIAALVVYRMRTTQSQSSSEITEPLTKI